MRVTVRIGGGLAGIVAVVRVDSRSLAPQDARAFAVEVDRAGLRQAAAVDQQLPPAGPASRGAGTPAPTVGVRPRADAQLYEISLEEEERRYVLHYTDDSLPPTVVALLRWVRQRPEREESLDH